MLNFILASKVLVTLETVLGLILADFIFGVLLSLRNSNFSFSKLPQFVETSLVPYIGGLLVLAVFSNVNTELGALFFTIAATISAKFLADIVTKAGQLFSGLQLQSPISVLPVTTSSTTNVDTVSDKSINVASTPSDESPSTGQSTQ